MIRVEKLWFSYIPGKWVLRNINLEIKDGELLAIVGPNGSGKTTLVKHFNGLLKPVRGRILVNGVDTKRVSVAELAKEVAYVFQNPNHQIFMDSVYDEVAFGPRNLGYSEEEVDRLVRDSLRMVGLERYINAYTYQLSAGERRRLTIASILAMNPSILILDEPTTGQDYLTCLRIMEVAKKCQLMGKTVIIISHDMELVSQWAERVIVMFNGEVVADGDPREIFYDLELMEKVSIDPPQIIKIAHRFKLRGRPLRIDEFMHEFGGVIQ